MQERVASPLICTVQAPQSAMPQPNFVPVRFSVSRRTQSSGICGSTSTVCDLPLRVKVTAIRTSRRETSWHQISYSNFIPVLFKNERKIDHSTFRNPLGSFETLPNNRARVSSKERLCIAH